MNEEGLKEYAFLTSHKLRASLSNILAIADQMGTRESNDQLDDFIKMLDHSSKRLDTVVREMNEVLSKDSYLEALEKETKHK